MIFDLGAFLWIIFGMALCVVCQVYLDPILHTIVDAIKARLQYKTTMVLNSTKNEMNRQEMIDSEFDVDFNTSVGPLDDKPNNNIFENVNLPPIGESPPEDVQFMSPSVLNTLPDDMELYIQLFDENGNPASHKTMTVKEVKQAIEDGILNPLAENPYETEEDEEDEE